MKYRYCQSPWKMAKETPVNRAVMIPFATLPPFPLSSSISFRFLSQSQQSPTCPAISHGMNIAAMIESATVPLSLHSNDERAVVDMDWTSNGSNRETKKEIKIFDSLIDVLCCLRKN
jgi:hypothetical protein